MTTLRKLFLPTYQPNITIDHTLTQTTSLTSSECLELSLSFEPQLSRHHVDGRLQDQVKEATAAVITCTMHEGERS